MVDQASEDWLNEQLPGIYGELSEVIREIFHRMPFGQEFTLSNGRKGRIKKFVEPRKREGGGWEFGFDVVFERGSPDHLEFFVKHTGGGSMVCEPTTPIMPSAHT